MTTPNIFSPDNIVRVNAVVSPTNVTPPFGRVLFLTDDSIDSVQSGRVAEYPTLAAMSDFGATAAPRLAGAAYFAQPGIKPPLLVAKWTPPTTATYLRGGAITAAASALVTKEATYTDGNAMQLGTQNIPYDDITFAGDTNYDDIANGLATAINSLSAYSGVSVTHVPVAGGNGYFQINFGTTGAPAVFANAGARDLATDMGLTAAAGAYIEYPHGESAATNIDAILAANQDWYFLSLDPSLRDTRAVYDEGAADIGLATVLNGHERMLIMDTAEDDALLTDETTSYAARVSALNLGRNAIVWSKRDYIGTALAALFATVDFTGRGTLKTAWGKTLAGFTPDNITATQKAELHRKRVNTYTNVARRSIIENGAVPGDDRWIDTRVWLDWFVNAVRHRIFTFLTSSAIGIPQDPRGQADLIFQIETICAQGVANGGIGPGQLSAALISEIAQQTNNPDFDGYLTTGYLVWAAPINEQTPNDRATRRAPRTYIWLHGRGFLQGVDIVITLY